MNLKISGQVIHGFNLIHVSNKTIPVSQAEDLFPMEFIGKSSQKTKAIVWHLLGHDYIKLIVIISLKAPGNYLDQFWNNKILVLLLERPPGNPYFWI